MTEVVETIQEEVVDAVEKVQYELDNGEMGSRSEFIRQEFKKDRSRSDIAAELEVPYTTVYSATANLHNEAHPEGVRNSRSQMVKKIDLAGNFVDADGNIVTDEAQAATIARTELMRQLVDGGWTRGNVAKHFDVPYSTVYAATKDSDTAGGSRTKITVVDPSTGEEVPRVTYIRKCLEEGMAPKAIAEHISMELGVYTDYSAIWTAKKGLSKDAEELIEVEEDVEASEGVYIEE